MQVFFIEYIRGDMKFPDVNETPAANGRRWKASPRSFTVIEQRPSAMF